MAGPRKTWWAARTAQGWPRQALETAGADSRHSAGVSRTCTVVNECRGEPLGLGDVAEVRRWHRERHLRGPASHHPRLERAPGTPNSDARHDHPLPSDWSARRHANTGGGAGQERRSVSPHRVWSRPGRPAERLPQAAQRLGRGGLRGRRARFPLSSSSVPGGPDAGDVVNQPLDMSYVIDAVLFDSLLPTGMLSGLVNPKQIGAAGHSNGAVSTLGLVANTCCQDARVKAAIVMAGATRRLPTRSLRLLPHPATTSGARHG